MTIKRNFKANTIEENTDVYADYLPGGRLFCAKYVENSTLRQLLYGLAGEITRVQEKIEELTDDYFLENTVNLIVEWERAVGIPDSCMSNTVLIEQRRLQVKAKLALMNLTTSADFVKLALSFGFAITIIPGEEVSAVFPFTFPITLFADAKHARFTMIVIFEGIPEPTNDFSLVFPITFSDNDNAEDFLRCVIKRLAPANVKVIFRYNP